MWLLTVSFTFPKAGASQPWWPGRVAAVVVGDTTPHKRADHQTAVAKGNAG